MSWKPGMKKMVYRNGAYTEEDPVDGLQYVTIKGDTVTRPHLYI